MTNVELSHYGIKGMRWGVRRSDSQLSKAAKESSDYKETKATRGKPASTLSNAELKKVNQRLQLETQYNKLNVNPALQSVKRGTENTKIIMGGVAAATSIYALTQSPAGQAVINSGKRAYNQYVNGAIALPAA